MKSFSFLLILTVLSLIIPTIASANPTKVASCYQNPMPENSGTRIDIDSVKYPNRPVTRIWASFYEENFEGEKLLSRQTMGEVKTSDATRLFIARWFKIKIDISAPPIQGKFPSKMITEDSNGITEQNILCQLF